MSMEKIFRIITALYFIYGAESITVDFSDGRYLIEVEGEIISDEIESALECL